MDVRKPSSRLKGMPQSQKPPRLISMGTRVSPAPRRMPAVTAWAPSKSWNTPATGSSVAARAIVATSLV